MMYFILYIFSYHISYFYVIHMNIYIYTLCFRFHMYTFIKYCRLCISYCMYYLVDCVYHITCTLSCILFNIIIYCIIYYFILFYFVFYYSIFCYIMFLCYLFIYIYFHYHIIVLIIQHNSVLYTVSCIQGVQRTS